MKKTDFKEKSSVFFIGRSFIIIAILITSSLSFTLGYFVGKSVHPPVVNQTFPIPVQQDSTEQKNIVAEEKELITQQPYQTQETQQTVEIPKTQETQQMQKTQSTKETRGTEETKKTKGTPKTRKYTVQAGAFRDASDADALKERLDKKGYKAYVTPSETKRHEKLYKVMIGKFRTRKEAEVLSIKIRKAESLQTFVTFKTE